MMRARASLDFAALARPVALALLGEPNPRASTAQELRYGRKGSLQVTIAGEWAGRWYDFEAGTTGGVLDLVARVQGGDRAAAARWLESQGFGDSLRARESNSEAPGARGYRGAGDGRTTAHGRPGQGSMRDSARRLWKSTRPLAGTIAEHYLNERGVGFVAGARCLRFHPGLRHRNAPGRFPALVAGVQDVSRRFMGIQRTYLDGPRKADLDPVRASLGSLAGGAVRLAPMFGDAVLVGEGIESTVAAVRVLDWPGGAWATLGTSGLRAVVLPESVRRVLIAADRDVGGLRAAAALADRLESERRRVTIEVPPCGDFADWHGESA